MENQIYAYVPVNDILPSKDNSRKMDLNTAEFAELTESIKAGGVRVPIHVRPHPEKKGKYEIRAGERRWRASKAAGQKTIPAIVHHGMDEMDAFDLTFVENKFRRDPKPLEEVAEIGKFMDRAGDEARLIASRIGSSEKWVRLRANVHRNLIPQWRTSLEKEPKLSGWGISHLVLIARLPKCVQKELLDQIKDDYYTEKQMTVAELDNRISKRLGLLRGAKWDLGDETLLPKAGSCEKCPKRTNHQPLLWFDTDGEKAKKNDQCLDALCWEAKFLAYLDRRAKKLKAEHDNLIYVFDNYPDYAVSTRLEKKFGRCLSKFNWTRRAKSNKKSVPALVVSGDNAGDLIWVEEHRIGGPRAGGSTGKPTPLKERKERLEGKRTAQVLLELRDAVKEATYEDITYADKITGLMAATAFYGNVTTIEYDRDNQKTIRQLVKAGNSRQAAKYLWETFKPTLDDLLRYNGPVTQTPNHYYQEAEWIAELIGADLEAVREKVSKMKGFTEPKAWKDLNADGTPKKKGTKNGTR